MANPQKIKGDRAERAVMRLLHGMGFPWTKKTRAGYERDGGDLHLVPGPAVICQTKWVRVARWDEWLRQLAEQVEQSGADTGFLAVKRNGIGEDRPEAWLAVMPLSAMAELLRRAGYGEAIVAADSPRDAVVSRV